ncbi:MAG TPA: hypothetical protein VHB50_22510 [Bryobacteraceae bacterium]|nr:hypothetical protein [Bryobacteraceae bacterium]
MLVNFEEELREAFRRESPSPDFAARVVARAAETKVTPIPFRSRPALWAIAAGLLLAAVVPPAVSEYHRRQEARALEARRQLITALTITRVQLRHTKERIQRATRHTL